MSASTPAQQAEFAGRQTPSSRLAGIPSWFISLVLHALLLFVVATSLKSCEGQPTGDPDAGMREVGLYDKESNALVERAAEETDNSATFQQPLDNDVPQPLIDDSPPTEIQTPKIDQRPDVLGVGGGAPPSFATENTVEGMALPNGEFKPTRIGALDKGETSFFGIRDSARQFTYVLDASGSMYGIAFQSAKAELNKSIQALGVHDRLHRVGNDLTAHQAGPHALVTHGDAVADRDRVEREGEAAGLGHPLLATPGQVGQRHVARGHLVPR